MNDTVRLVQEARGALTRLQAELAKIEYLATARLPQVEDLWEPLRKHAGEIAAGLAVLAKKELRAGGVYVADPDG
jgi:hypothetical protein